MRRRRLMLGFRGLDRLARTLAIGARSVDRVWRAAGRAFVIGSGSVDRLLSRWQHGV
jgi:hypothetical protein